mmetsp:Transcript_28101/g.36239  ORF Transcript_28101/g.36239 Transcript_28101/m.36239 type:complete len:89 (+) Transcript_28101:171-437(+)
MLFQEVHRMQKQKQHQQEQQQQELHKQEQNQQEREQHKQELHKQEQQKQEETKNTVDEIRAATATRTTMKNHYITTNRMGSEEEVAAC